MIAIPTITKAQALALYDGNSAAFARDVNRTRQMIYHLDDGPLPPYYALMVRFVLKPEAFETGDNVVPSNHTAPQEAA